MLPAVCVLHPCTALTTPSSYPFVPRYYLVEKAKGASIIGLLVGTLGAAGYLLALQQVRHLAEAAGKKTYTFLMGKPNPAKLANFPEVEVFVMLADPQGLILDSKEYLAPIITPFEAALAFTGQSLDMQTYRLDFEPLLEMQVTAVGYEQHDEDVPNSHKHMNGTNGALVVSDVPGRQQGSVGASGRGEIMLSGAASRGGKGEIVARSAGEYLAVKRSYQGLETPATGADIKSAELAVAGRVGRAAGYAHEPACGH